MPDELFQNTILTVVDALEREAESHWAIGEALARLPATKGIDKAIASEVGKSAAWVSDHRRAAVAFPPELRALDMPFQIHVACARTSSPADWLAWAVEEQASTRQLREKLAEEGEIKTRDSSAQTAPDRVQWIMSFDVEHFRRISPEGRRECFDRAYDAESSAGRREAWAELERRLA